MPFPLSPANNQTALVNGIVYQWNSTLGTWKRNGSINSASIGQLLLTSAQQSTTNGSGTLIVSGGAGITGNVYTGGIFITGAANGITFVDGSVQTTAATGIDQYARNTANTNATNITVIQGVNTTQNTNITAVDVKAQAAFDKANSNFSSSGGTITGDTVLTGNLTVTGATIYANTENLNVKDNIITLNSNVTGAPSLSAGIEVNRGSSTNTKLLWSEANTSWEFTNNGTTYEKIPALTYVQAAFDKANTAEGSVGFAAFDKANSANVLAQAAFNAANTAIGGAVLTSTVDTFTGNGSNTAFTLSTTPATINYTTAVVGGVTQPRSAYSVIGTTLTFTSAPANTQIIEVTTIGTSNTTLYTVNNIISPFLLMGA
jgi:hypothetical protein